MVNFKNELTQLGVDEFRQGNVTYWDPQANPQYVSGHCHHCHTQYHCHAHCHHCHTQYHCHAHCHHCHTQYHCHAHCHHCHTQYHCHAGSVYRKD
ncbi:heterocycloanthracin/sonorensin family bacteriocin [Oceanobacillus salinisoli]|uniref:heterocycloanthracin/sonorensin family bacteriocin n=1 Tax=Oceanobacillus salinisoli TaxID=2678611 RepID=UPI0012E140B7